MSMRWRRFAVLGIVAATACSDLTDTEQEPRARVIPSASQQDLLPGSGACTNCVYGPRVLSKSGPSARGFDGAFDADPNADYMLVVKSSDPTARVEAWLNGVKVMSRGALELAAGTEATAQLTVQGRNILQVVLYGAAGVKATVAVVGGARTIGSAGGTVTMPGGAATLRIPPGALTASTPITLQREMTSPPNTSAQTLGNGISLQPEGLSFATAVTLTLSYAPVESLLPAGYDPNRLGALHWRQDGTFAEVVPGSVDPASKSIAIALSHFSAATLIYSPAGWVTMDVRWTIPTIQWYLEPPAANQPSYLTTSAIQTALNMWQAQTSSFVFQQTTSRASANIIFEEAGTLTPGTYCPGVFSLAQTSGTTTLGITCFDALAKLVQRNLGTNNYTTIRLASTAFSNAQDAQRTIAHEVGHALGIHHPVVMLASPPQPLMQQSLYFGGTALHALDIAALQSLYAPPVAPPSLAAAWHGTSRNNDPQGTIYGAQTYLASIDFNTNTANSAACGNPGTITQKTATQLTIDFPGCGLDVINYSITNGNTFTGQGTMTAYSGGRQFTTWWTLNPRQLAYADDFSTGLANWTVRNVDGLGTWFTQNDELFGDYNIGCGSSGCNHTQLLLADALQPASANWRMEVQSNLVQAYCCYNGGSVVSFSKFVLWVSDAMKEAISVGYWWQGLTAPSTFNSVMASHEAWPWVSIGNPTLPTVAPWSPTQWQTGVLEKRGNTYAVYFNGMQVYSTTRTFPSAPKIGFSTYGKVRMDNFKLYTLP